MLSLSHGFGQSLLQVSTISFVDCVVSSRTCVQILHLLSCTDATLCRPNQPVHLQAPILSNSSQREATDSGKPSDRDSLAVLVMQQPAGTPPMAQATAPPILPQLLLLPQTQHAPNLSGTPDASAAAAPPPQLFSGAAASPGFATPAPASGGAGSTSFIDSAAAASSPFTVPVLSVVAGLPTACSSPTTRPLQPLQVSARSNEGSASDLRVAGSVLVLPFLAK